MKQVAKVLIIDNKGSHLLMKRANHPIFQDDPDLPGGTIEEGEELLDGAIREVTEEANITLSPKDLTLVYSGHDYSTHNTEYNLYIAHIAQLPAVTISWEHSSYDWVNYEELLKQAQNANDTYMHMVHDVITKQIH